MRRQRTRLTLCIGVLVVFAATGIATSGVFTWSPLNCWHEEIDIASGRIRRSRLFLYCKVREQIEETWVSRSLGESTHNADWHRVNTFSPGVHHSPHYRYHGAISQVSTLKLAGEAILFDQDASRYVAQRLLTYWQREGDDFAGGEYAESVAQVAYDKLGNDEVSVKLVDVIDIDAPQ